MAVDAVTRKALALLKLKKPRPLSEKELAALTERAGGVLPPSMEGWLRVDASWLIDAADWPSASAKWPIAPLAKLVADHADALAECYELPLAKRFPDAMAMPLDAGSDSARFLVLGGDFPVLFIDHDDTPILGVSHASFGQWALTSITQMFGANSTDAATRKLGKQLFPPDGHIECMAEHE